MKYVGDRPFADPEAAARKLLEIVLSKDIDVGQYAYTGATNSAFLESGGSIAEYSAGRDYAVARGWFEIDRGLCCCRPARTCDATNSQGQF
jgi:hypothetical protein